MVCFIFLPLFDLLGTPLLSYTFNNNNNIDPSINRKQKFHFIVTLPLVASRGSEIALVGRWPIQPLPLTDPIQVAPGTFPEGYFVRLLLSQTTSGLLTTSSITTSQVTTSPVTSAQVTSGLITTSQVTSGTITSGDVTTSVSTLAPITSGVVAITSGAITSGESNLPITSGIQMEATTGGGDVSLANGK